MTIYQISSGQGPAECELGVAKMLAYLQNRHDVTLLGTSKGSWAGTYRSVLLASEEDLSSYLGSVQWTCRSPYRPEHRRKNWFLDFHEFALEAPAAFDEAKITYETFHCGGKGGQNVNKVETGVRAIYAPTGFAVECTEERTQAANKRKATARLKRVMEELAKSHAAKEKKERWKQHAKIVRGNAVAIFVGPDFERT